MQEFFVYSLTIALPTYRNCIIVEAGGLVRGIRTKVFGPAPESECQKWVEEHCVTSLKTSKEVLADTHTTYTDDELYLTVTREASTASFFPIDEGSVLPLTPTINLELEIPPAPVGTARFSSQEGARVTQRLIFLGGGGHSHGQNTTDPRAVGSVSPRNFTIVGPYPQNMPVVYTCGEAAGDVLWEVTFTKPNGGVDVLELDVKLSVLGLQPLTSSLGIVLVGKTSSHPNNHFGTPALCNGVAKLAASFFGRFSKPIYINDMSLIGGGIFDIDANFRPDHKTHRVGRNVDINLSSMSEQERLYFRTTAEGLGFNVDAHGTPVHWHLTI